MESLVAFLTCFFKAKASLLIAGFFGGIIRSIVSKTGSKWQKLLGGFMGAILSAYFTPIGVALLGTSIPVSSISFIVGLVGMSLVEALISIGRDYQKHPGKLKHDLRDVLLRILGAKKEGE
ncbi:hypothetical protein [Neorhizobium sp. NCHU2750]|uniref:hypothetical protein n=1 Tax=Neorhizobium sp. NCHU2750 TaxID=1825976 RepID=UPI000E722521|nr:hypothetical protein NCHU2750_15350 [Neorhizobium sp. NCHU2750]